MSGYVPGNVFSAWPGTGYSSQNVCDRTPPWNHKILSCYDNICCTDRLNRSIVVHQNSSPWYHGFWCPGDRAAAVLVLTLCLCIWTEKKICRINSLRPSEALCISKLTIIGSDNGLLPGQCQAIIWTNAGILLIGPLGTNFSEILIEIHTFPFKKMHLKMLSANGIYVVLVLAMMLRCNNVLCTG